MNHEHLGKTWNLEGKFLIFTMNTLPRLISRFFYVDPEKMSVTAGHVYHFQMTFGPKFNDLHSFHNERQLQKSLFPFGEECEDSMS